VTVPAGIGIRSAGVGDAETIGQLLHDFNLEFDERTPGPGAIAERVRQLLAAEEIAVLLTATEAHGLVVLRFRPALYADALDCCVEELYVVPQRRGQGTRAGIDGGRDRARPSRGCGPHGSRHR
jgi:hypothetical protein